MAEELKLASEFPEVSYDQWVTLCEKVLKGAPFEKKLVSSTYEGTKVQPLYDQSTWDASKDANGLPGFAPFTRGGNAAGKVQGGWDVRQLHTNPDLSLGNASILEDLERGVSSLTLRFDAAIRAGAEAVDGQEGVAEDGIAAYSTDDLDKLLAGVYLNLAPLALEGGANFIGTAAATIALLQSRDVKPEEGKTSFGADPIGTLAANGALPQGIDAALAQAGDLASYVNANLPGSKAVRVDTAAVSGAGSSEAQELGAALATGLAYLKALTAAGLSVDDAAKQIDFSFSIGTDFFQGMAKLRAARRLWSRVVDACGGSKEAGAMVQNAKTAERVMSKRDPWVNMLRTTVTSFAGAVGGADSVSTLPFDAALGVPTDFGRRIARNLQVLLSEESNVAKVIDPAGGSWYIENATNELADKGWAFFQAIEAEGGMVAALQSGWLAAQIGEVQLARAKNIAKRKDSLTGVNEFPNISEEPVKTAAVDVAAVAKAAAARVAGAEAVDLPAAGAGDLTAAAVAAAAQGASIGKIAAALGGDATTVDALPVHSLHEDFEALRDAADAYKEANGSRPLVFLANLGRVAQHTARATFAKNYFEAGGIEAVTNEGFSDKDALVAAYKESGAKIAVFTGGDDQYEDVVADYAPALKEAGVETLYLAGRPGDKADAYTAAGVDKFIGMGDDVLANLQEAHRALGV